MGSSVGMPALPNRIIAPFVRPSTVAPPRRHLVLRGVERSSGWCRHRTLPRVGGPVALVPSIHAGRLNVVDERTLELLGWVPADSVADVGVAPAAIGGSVLSVQAEPTPVIVVDVRAILGPTA